MLIEVSKILHTEFYTYLRKKERQVWLISILLQLMSLYLIPLFETLF